MQIFARWLPLKCSASALLSSFSFRSAGNWSASDSSARLLLPQWLSRLLSPGSDVFFLILFKCSAKLSRIRAPHSQCTHHQHLCHMISSLHTLMCLTAPLEFIRAICILRKWNSCKRQTRCGARRKSRAIFPSAKLSPLFHFLCASRLAW